MIRSFALLRLAPLAVVTLAAEPQDVARLKATAEAMMQAMQAMQVSLATGPSVRRVAQGTPETGFDTELTDGAQPAYIAWRARVAPDDPGTDYDYPGAFAADAHRDASGSMPGRFKKPNHPTFRADSQYAGYASAKNPNTQARR